MPDRRLPALSIPVAAGLLYFSQGLPYGVVTELAPIYLRTRGVSLAEIGLLSTAGLAWTLKFFWAPLVDRWGTYRRWIAWALVVLVLGFGALALETAAGSPAFWVAILILVLASATQDISIDAFTIAATPERLLGPINSIRLAAYRVAIIAGGGGLALVAARFGWRAAFGVAAIATLALLAATPLLPTEQRAPGGVRPAYLASLRRSINRPNAARLFGIVLLYRAGDAALLPMIKTFWIDRGYSIAEVGTVTTVIGWSLTIAGAVVGGLFVSRYGIVKGLLWLGTLQMLSNAGYALVATLDGGRLAIYSAAVVENFTSGLGATAFLTFLMAMCDRENAATEYALLTAIFGLMRSVAGSLSGIGAERMGYAGYFWLTVAAGVPALVLVWMSRRSVREAT